ncbi:MAG TPA: hypothetical protein VIR81_00815, partial [Myxococcales bacterium]
PGRVAASDVPPPRPRTLGLERTRMRPTLYNEMLQARHYRGLYERLKDSAEGQTAEGKLVLYEILRQCANITEGRRPGYRATPPKRDDFLAGLAPTDPQRDKRIAAYEDYAADRCGDLASLNVTEAQLNRLLGEAAALRNPQAMALSIEQDLWKNRRQGSGTISDDQVQRLKEIANTKDPEAIRVAGRVLANSWTDYGLRIGPDQQPVESRPFVNAFLVLACEYGAPCGADTPRMLQACAFSGHCEADSFPDDLYYYGSSPHDSELMLSYRSLVRRAIETGDWSQINVVRGAGAAGNRMTFVPGPR